MILIVMDQRCHWSHTPAKGSIKQHSCYCSCYLFCGFFSPHLSLSLKYQSPCDCHQPGPESDMCYNATLGFTSCFSVRVACTATWIRQHIFISKWQIGQIPMIPKTTYVTVPKMTYYYLHCHVVNVVKTFAAWLGLGSDLVRKKHHGLKEVR